VFFGVWHQFQGFPLSSDWFIVSIVFVLFHQMCEFINLHNRVPRAWAKLKMAAREDLDRQGIISDLLCLVFSRRSFEY